MELPKPRPPIPLRHRLCTLLLGAALLPQIALATDQPQPVPASPSLTAIKAAELRDRYGIELQGIRPAAAGYMLDLRYKVIDAVKAATLVNRQLKPYLIDEQRNIQLITPTPPKVGALRQTAAPIHQGRQYVILFANPARGVKPGDKVSVAMGTLKLENLTVQ